MLALSVVLAIDSNLQVSLLTAAPYALGAVAMIYWGRPALRVLAAFPAFWTLATAFLTGVTAAAGIATVNSLGNVSGFFGPYWVGAMSDLFGSAKWGPVTIGVVMVLGSVVVSVLGD